MPGVLDAGLFVAGHWRAAEEAVFSCVIDK
jgi:hypothetical protein